MPGARIGLANNFQAENSAEAKTFLVKCPFELVEGALCERDQQFTLLHARSQRLVAILLAVPENYRRQVFCLTGFFHVDRHCHFLLQA